MHVTSTTRARIETGGDGVVAHVGLHALGRFADTLGLGAALSARIVPTGERFPFHDRGKVLVHAMLMLAGGGEACSDIEVLRAQPACSGRCRRTRRCIAPTARSTRSPRPGCGRRWPRSARRCGRRSMTGEPVVLDIDGSLIEIHSENKDGTAANYKRGFGFHPMFCFADATGETLAARLRPGNATANNAADHLTVLDDAIGQLPAEIAAGHRPGD